MNKEILNFMNKKLDDSKFSKKSYPQPDDEDYIDIIHLALLADAPSKNGGARLIRNVGPTITTGTIRTR